MSGPEFRLMLFGGESTQKNILPVLITTDYVNNPSACAFDTTASLTFIEPAPLESSQADAPV